MDLTNVGCQQKYPSINFKRTFLKLKVINLSAIFSKFLFVWGRKSEGGQAKVLNFNSIGMLLTGCKIF